MIKITDSIRREVEEYLQVSNTNESDEFYAFYYKCMVSDMHPLDADRYAALNTLFNYDIGLEAACEIVNWLDRQCIEVFELKATSLGCKAELMKAADELKLNLDFKMFSKEDYIKYKFFEQ